MSYGKNTPLIPNEVLELVPLMGSSRKTDADAKAHEILADMHMPDDLRARAREWKLEHFMEAVWRAGFQSGFRIAQDEPHP